MTTGKRKANKASARRPERPGAVTGLLADAASAAGYAISRNPVLVGGTTAFMVTAFYVSANALWYQPYFHSSAFLATRTVVQPAAGNDQPRRVADPVPVRSVPVTKIAVPSDPPQAGPGMASDTMRTDAIPAPMPAPQAVAAPAPATGGDETLRQVQAALAGLGLYTGEVDGLNGPKTRAAVENYQRIAGMEPTGKADAAMLKRLGMQGQTRPVPDTAPAVAAAPVPNARPQAAVPAATKSTQTAMLEQASPEIMRIQAGLRAFGNQGVELDGKMGQRTREALKEFQSLFGLPVTGNPDAAVMAKMREIGLTN